MDNLLVKELITIFFGVSLLKSDQAFRYYSSLMLRCGVTAAILHAGLRLEIKQSEKYKDVVLL